MPAHKPSQMSESMAVRLEEPGVIGMDLPMISG